MNEMKKMIIIVITAIIVGVSLASCRNDHVNDERYVSRYISEDTLSALLKNDILSARVKIDEATTIELEKRNVNKDWFIIREYELQEGTYEEVDAIIATCNHPKEFSEKAKLIDEQIDRLLDQQ